MLVIVAIAVAVTVAVSVIVAIAVAIAVVVNIAAATIALHKSCSSKFLSIFVVCVLVTNLELLKIYI